MPNVSPMWVHAKGCKFCNILIVITLFMCRISSRMTV